VARAKRTERADARRRHRGTQAGIGDENRDDAVAGTAVPPGARDGGRPTRAGRDATPTAPAAPQRPPSFTGAFRAAARPLNVRDDIAFLPRLIRHRAVWIPVLATTVAGILLVAVGATNQLVNVVAQVFVVPPPMAASFLAGLLAPRASYLAGGIAGVWAALVFTGVVFTVSSATEIPVTTNDRVSVALYGLAVSPLFGLAVGGFAGYYRRFLAVSSPARRRQEQSRGARGSNRPAPRRR
jgi:hypothetical protein